MADDLEGNLRTVTDREWLDAHTELIALVGGEIPEEELAYVWEPELCRYLPNDDAPGANAIDDSLHARDVSCVSHWRCLPRLLR